MNPENLKAHEALHAKLVDIWLRLEDDMQAISERAYATDSNPIELRFDTAMAIGHAVGLLNKARGLLGRDIDENGHTPKVTPMSPDAIADAGVK